MGGNQGGGGHPSYNNQSYTHRPKLEDDYRNKNIHKVKRMHGSSVVSPGTEKALNQQAKMMFRREGSHNQNSMGLMGLPTPPPIGLVGKSRTMQPMLRDDLPNDTHDESKISGGQYKRIRLEDGRDDYNAGDSSFGHDDRHGGKSQY